MTEFDSAQADRLRKRMALARERPAISNTETNLVVPGEGAAIAEGSGFLALIPVHDDLPILEAEGEVSLEMLVKLDQERREAFLDACQNECLQAVLRPFGVGRVLFEGKLGGNVATVHNVRQEEYQNSDNTAWAMTGERDEFNLAENTTMLIIMIKTWNFLEKGSRTRIRSRTSYGVPKNPQ